MTYSISVIIPVYNEKDLLDSAFKRIELFLGSHFNDYEIIIVESGSTDGTEKISDALTHSNPCTRVIHEGGRNGFGSALRLGYQNACKDLVWMITADIPFPLEAILQALPYFERYDCVLSYRSHDKRTFFRQLQSAVYNLLVKMTLGIKVRHVNSAFKVFKRPALQCLTLTSRGWFIDVEILYRIKETGLSSIEIPVQLIERTSGQSSIAWYTPFFMLRELLLFFIDNRTY